MLARWQSTEHRTAIFNPITNSIIAMGNDALNANPISAGTDITINTKGSNWLWAVFAVMLFTDLLMMAWMFTLPKGRRTFHHVAIFILTTASIAYFR